MTEAAELDGRRQDLERTLKPLYRRRDEVPWRNRGVDAEIARLELELQRVLSRLVGLDGGRSIVSTFAWLR